MFLGLLGAMGIGLSIVSPTLPLGLVFVCEFGAGPVKIPVSRSLIRTTNPVIVCPVLTSRPNTDRAALRSYLLPVPHLIVGLV